MAGGINLAKQDFGNGTSAFLARIPRLQNRGQMFVFPCQRNGRTAAINHYHGLARCVERPYQLRLHFGQLNRITVKSFTFLGRSDTADIDYQIRIRRVAESFIFELRQGTGRFIILFTPRSSAGLCGNRTAHGKSNFDVRPG